jgi:hypothetical protein
MPTKRSPPTSVCDGVATVGEPTAEVGQGWWIEHEGHMGCAPGKRRRRRSKPSIGVTARQWRIGRPAAFVTDEASRWSPVTGTCLYIQEGSRRG